MDEILKARRDMKESDDRRDAGLKVPEDVECFYSIPYGEDGIWQILDVYRPKNTAGALPVIVNVHGGGWIYGTKETYRFYCMDLARRGFAVVNFTYRLAPEHMFPASLEDTCSVFGWVLENAERFGFDAKRVFAVGDSITVGAGIYADPSTLNANENSDVAKCYAYLTAQELDADFSFVATEAICTKSKKFLTINAIEMYGQYSATHAGKYKIKEPYDIVVVGLGTNDASALAADPSYTPAALQADYTELLTLIRASNPEAKIVCVYGMMGETPTVKTSFTNAIAALGDENITYCTLPASTDGGQGHPSVKGAVTEAQTLLEHIRSLEA